jgi:hypothetical protein
MWVIFGDNEFEENGATGESNSSDDSTRLLEELYSGLRRGGYSI